MAVINFSLYDYYKYGFTADSGEYQLVLNSDDLRFGGRGIITETAVKTDENGYLELTIPASSVQYFYKPAAAKHK